MSPLCLEHEHSPFRVDSVLSGFSHFQGDLEVLRHFLGVGEGGLGRSLLFLDVRCPGRTP